MKYRSGFISNSSSCSFVFMGFDVTELDKEFDRKDFSDGNWRLMNDIENGAPEGKVLIGQDINVWDECSCMETTQIDPKNTRVEEMELIKQTYELPDDMEPTVWVGMRCC